MLVLKASPDLEDSFSQMLKQFNRDIGWRGLFLVNNNTVVLYGNSYSLCFSLDNKKIFMDVVKSRFSESIALDCKGNHQLINSINILMYIFGKWGLLKGLNVKQKYTQLNKMFEKIFDDFNIYAEFDERAIVFYDENDVLLTYEDVLNIIIDVTMPEEGAFSKRAPKSEPPARNEKKQGKASKKVEKESEPDLEEKEPRKKTEKKVVENENIEAEEKLKAIRKKEESKLGLWYDMQWRLQNLQFEYKALDADAQRGGKGKIAKNFAITGYTCPNCGQNTHMVVFPPDKEMAIKVEQDRVFMTRAFTCPSCRQFYTPKPDHLISEKEVYSLDFLNDEAAYEDYLELLSEKGYMGGNSNFNEYESTRMSKGQNTIENPDGTVRPEVFDEEDNSMPSREVLSLEKAIRNLDTMGLEETEELMDMMESGFYSRNELEKYDDVAKEALKNKYEELIEDSDSFSIPELEGISLKIKNNKRMAPKYKKIFVDTLEEKIDKRKEKKRKAEKASLEEKAKQAAKELDTEYDVEEAANDTDVEENIKTKEFSDPFVDFDYDKEYGAPGAKKEKKGSGLFDKPFKVKGPKFKSKKKKTVEDIIDDGMYYDEGASGLDNEFYEPINDFRVNSRNAKAAEDEAISKGKIANDNGSNFVEELDDIMAPVSETKANNIKKANIKDSKQELTADSRLSEENKTRASDVLETPARKPTIKDGQAAGTEDEKKASVGKSAELEDEKKASVEKSAELEDEKKASVENSAKLENEQTASGEELEAEATATSVLLAIANECNGKDYKKIREAAKKIKGLNAKDDKAKEKILGRLSEYKKKRGRSEAKHLLEKLKPDFSKKDYLSLKKRFKDYDSEDIKDIEEELDRRLDKKETDEIKSIIAKENANSRLSLHKLFKNLSSKDYEERNSEPFIKKIRSSLEKADSLYIGKLCEDYDKLDFNQAAKVYNKLAQSVCLPKLKIEKLNEIEDYLKTLKTDEAKLLVEKLKEDIEPYNIDLSVLSFSNIGTPVEGLEDNPDNIVIYNAKNSYAETGQYEYPLVCHDSSKKITGKYGFTLTPDKFYIGTRSFSAKYSIKDIDRFERRKKRIKENVVLVTNKGEEANVPCSYKGEEMEGLVGILNSFTTYLKAKPESRNVEYLSQKSHDVRICLRCGSKYSGGGICPECGMLNED